MKVYLKTTLTPTLKVYDTTVEGRSFLARILNPVITVTRDDGLVVYKYGESEAQSLFPFIAMAGILALGIWIFVR